jgi:hypothetical protein
MAAAIRNQINTIIASVLSSSTSKSIGPPIPIPDALKGVDDLIHAGFDAYRNACFHWLLVATGFVVVGLVFEGPELWHEITSIVSHWRFIRKFQFSLPEQHIPDWAKLLAFVGWLLIVAGVAGEYVADSFVSKADGYVQTFDEILLTEARTRTAFASERASAAYERAAKTEKEATQENERAAKALQAAEIARKDAEGLQLQIAKANERAADADRIAESERLVRVELEKQLQPRRLTGEQKKKLTSLLSDNPQSIMFGWCMNGSDDCQDLVNDFGEAFNKAGWKTLFGASLRNKRGVQVGFARGSDEQLASHWVPKIRNALSEVGLASEQEWFDPNDKWLVGGGFEKNVLYMIVGQKPVINTKTTKADTQ